MRGQEGAGGGRTRGYGCVSQCPTPRDGANMLILILLLTQGKGHNELSLEAMGHASKEVGHI